MIAFLQNAVLSGLVEDLCVYLLYLYRFYFALVKSVGHFCFGWHILVRLLGLADDIAVLA
jgi:hypothetical protein